MRFLDWFAGIGGFRLGLERASPEYRCVGACESDRWCRRVYGRRFGREPEWSDSRSVDPSELPDSDLLCAGFPCQSFSVAGKRAGFADIRGTLFFEVARIADRKRPPLLLLENVPGILSSESGATFETVLRTLDEVGYDAEWSCLNSRFFGVPQNRERVFIVGYLRGGLRPQVFPLREDAEICDGASGEVAICLDAGYHKGWLDHGQRTVVWDAYNRREAGQATSLRRNMGNGGPLVVENRNRNARTDGLTHTMHGGRVNNPPIVVLDGGQAYRMYDPQGASPALPTPSGGHHIPKIANAPDADGYLRFGARLRDGNGKPQLPPVGCKRLRRLTPLECERLQGFPDHFTAEGVDERGNIVRISDTQRYRMLGNAVTTTVVEAIGRRLIEALKEAGWTE